ncbi:hypothetical protein DDE82_002474 [Stemphylium lycopersici]|uniref:Uncharacterized protein n=1 Tax=Stemphylium lycopersici TaxID=183478 RepID=A0A364N568_STELY|nr:hypothetical protein DDE82_002474 [Stemphylium lycopersici]RAR11720.1 hypothetical protein DDE83_004446 [Stemphylium lycopersici]
MKTLTLLLATLMAALASAEPIPTTTPPKICTKICAFSPDVLDCGDEWVSSSFYLPSFFFLSSTRHGMLLCSLV